MAMGIIVAQLGILNISIDSIKPVKCGIDAIISSSTSSFSIGFPLEAIAQIPAILRISAVSVSAVRVARGCKTIFQLSRVRLFEF